MPIRDLMSIPVREAGSGRLHVIVETPRGSRSKFRYDAPSGLFMLYKLLPLGAAFPYDFGFIPGTLEQDGDPLDVLVIGAEPTFVGCLVTVRVLGVIEANQTDRGVTIRNDRLVAVPETERIRPSERTLDDLPARTVDEIEHFFVSYNVAQNRVFEVVARRGPQVAERRIEESVANFRSGKKKALRGAGAGSVKGTRAGRGRSRRVAR
jgi:inorganic pyrophosphatase